MKKYCLNLMGLDQYQRKEEINSGILKDVKRFADKLKVPLKVKNNGIVIGHHQIPVIKLNEASGRKQLFKWIMEEYGDYCI